MMSHARIKSRLASSINQLPLVQDEIFKRSSYIAEALDFRAMGYADRRPHVLASGEPAT